MHKLKAITAQGSAAPSVSTIGSVTITEVTDRALASLSMRLGQDAEFIKRTKESLGFDLPAPGGAVVGSPFSAFWISPDNWMIDASYSSHESLAAELMLAMQDTASVVGTDRRLVPLRCERSDRLRSVRTALQCGYPRDESSIRDALRHSPYRLLPVVS